MTQPPYDCKNCQSLFGYFFSSDECIACTERAEAAVIIPLLQHLVEQQELALGSLLCLPTTGIPIIQWPNQSKVFYVCLRELVSLLTAVAPDPCANARERSVWQNRERRLCVLSQSYHDLLAQSLQDVAWMKPGLTEKPDAVQSVATLAL